MTLRVNSAGSATQTSSPGTKCLVRQRNYPYFELVADDSVYEYEKAHLPDDGWPPTSWYAGWVSDVDVFDVEREQCPIEMRWLVYQSVR